MKKKTIIILCAIIAIFLMFIFIGCSFFYRFITLNSIYKKLDKYLAKLNFKLVTTVHQPEGDITTYTYFKDRTGKFISSDGTYTWARENGAFFINDKEQVIVEVDPQNTVGAVGPNLVTSLYLGYNQNLWERILFVSNLNNEIKSTKLDGVKCYKISQVYDKYKTSIWIEKKTNTIVRSEIYLYDTKDVLFTEYKLNFSVVKEKDIDLVGVENYKFINQEGEEAVNRLKYYSRPLLEGQEEKTEDTSNDIVVNLPSDTDINSINIYDYIPQN